MKIWQALTQATAIVHNICLIFSRQRDAIPLGKSQFLLVELPILIMNEELVIYPNEVHFPLQTKIKHVLCAYTTTWINVCQILMALISKDRMFSHLCNKTHHISRQLQNTKNTQKCSRCVQNKMCCQIKAGNYVRAMFDKGNRNTLLLVWVSFAKEIYLYLSGIST